MENFKAIGNKSFCYTVIIYSCYSLLFLFNLQFHLTECSRDSRTSELVSSDYFSKAGKWGSTDYCPEGQFVYGVKLTAQNHQEKCSSCTDCVDSNGRRVNIGWQPWKEDIDNMGITNVKFYCGENWNETRYKTTKTLESYGASQSVADSICSKNHGVRDQKFMKCPKGFITGYQVKVQEKQGTGDDNGITNFRFDCSDGSVLYNSVDIEPGTWETPRPAKCHKESLVCGIQTKYEDTHGDDNTGLNSVRVQCCKADPASIHGIDPNAAHETCNATVGWEIIAEGINSGFTELEYEYTSKVGISHTKGKTQSETNTNTKGKDTTWGIEAGAEFEFGGFKASLTAKFEETYKTESTTSKVNENSFSDVWDSETTRTTKIKALPGTRYKLEQWVGECGPYKVRTRAIRKIDEYLPVQTQSNGISKVNVAINTIVLELIVGFFLLYFVCL